MQRNSHDLYRSPKLHARQADPVNLTQLCKDLGPVVYFIRTPEGPIKIGTTNGWLQGRKNARHAAWTDILAIIPGGFDDEQAWHARFHDEALGRELFAPSPRLMAAINEIRDRMGVAAI